MIWDYVLIWKKSMIRYRQKSIELAQRYANIVFTTMSLGFVVVLSLDNLEVI